MKDRTPGCSSRCPVRGLSPRRVFRILPVLAAGLFALMGSTGPADAGVPGDGPQTSRSSAAPQDRQKAAQPAAAGQARPASRSKATEGPRLDLEALHVQVVLDRAGFSPGVIDGHMGPTTRRALALYQQHRGAELTPDAPALVPYAITPDDTAGPFTAAIPSDLVEQAALPALGYTSVLEALAERFHTSPGVLQRLNPAAQFTAGEEVQVPNVEPLLLPVERLHVGPEGRAVRLDDQGDKKLGDQDDKKKEDEAVGTSGRREAAGARGGGEPNTIMSRPDVVVTVSRGNSMLTVTDATGQMLFAAPVSTGSDRDPLPIGEWKVTGLQFNPVFHYNPKLFWDADPAHSKTRIKPGPNNPVGLVWIDLSKEHYGLHGTPEPAGIGRGQSHGCVRLTNWDALRVAGMVKPGTQVVFTE